MNDLSSFELKLPNSTIRVRAGEVRGAQSVWVSCSSAQDRLPSGARTCPYPRRATKGSAGWLRRPSQRRHPKFRFLEMAEKATDRLICRSVPRRTPACFFDKVRREEIPQKLQPLFSRAARNTRRFWPDSIIKWRVMYGCIADH